MKKLMRRSKQIEHWEEIKNNSSKLNIKEKLNCGSEWDNYAEIETDWTLRRN